MITDDWHDRFLALAFHIAGWSKDPSTKVGAVIVDPESRAILTTGYNGLPRGVEDSSERLHDRAFKLHATAHAEANAIFHAARLGIPLMNAVLYSTFPPCATCATSIIQVGISGVVVPRLMWPERWRESFAAGRDLLLEVGLVYVQRPWSRKQTE